MDKDLEATREQILKAHQALIDEAWRMGARGDQITIYKRNDRYDELAAPFVRELDGVIADAKRWRMLLLTIREQPTSASNRPGGCKTVWSSIWTSNGQAQNHWRGG